MLLRSFNTYSPLSHPNTRTREMKTMRNVKIKIIIYKLWEKLTHEKEGKDEKRKEA